MKILHLISEYDIPFEILLSLISFFTVNRFLNSSLNRESVSTFVRFLVSTAFTYTGFVLRLCIKFVLDFFIAKSDLQWTARQSAGDMRLIEILGGRVLESQYPVADTMFDIICMMLGCAVGGIVLSAVYSRKNRKDRRVDNGNKTEKVHI